MSRGHFEQGAEELVASLQLTTFEIGSKTCMNIRDKTFDTCGNEHFNQPMINYINAAQAHI